MNSKEKIKTVALDLFIEKGIPATTTKMITELAEVSNGALFHHFKSKDDIVITLYTDNKRELLDTIYESVKGSTDIKEFIYNHFTSDTLWCLTHPNEKTFINQVAKSPVIKNCGDYQVPKKMNFINNFIQSAIDNKQIEAKDLLSFLLNFTAFVDATVDYLGMTSDVNHEDYIDYNFERFWNSIKKN